MALSGQAKSEYQREYMRRKRNGEHAKPVPTRAASATSPVVLTGCSLAITRTARYVRHASPWPLPGSPRRAGGSPED